MQNRTHGGGWTPGARVLVALISVLVLSSCASADDAHPSAVPSASAPAPSRSAEPSAPSVPTVPTRSADLASLVHEPGPTPVELTVTSLDLTVPIDPVGVRDDGQMEIPPMAERAGWYRFGATSGSTEGTTVVAAHVDSVASAGLGPFSRLVHVAVGDPVAVTLTDGSVLTYTVSSVAKVAKPEVEWPDVFVQDGPPRLVLVTCGGSFRRAVRSYSDNVIVTAEPDGA